MKEVLLEFGKKISLVGSPDDYRKIIYMGTKELQRQGLSGTAKRIREMSYFAINRFSKVSTLENMKNSKERVLEYLDTCIREEDTISQEVSVIIIKRMLFHFHLYCKSLYKDNLHGKCSEPFRNGFCGMEIGNEYDVQHLMYPLIRSVFPEARLEKCEDSGHHTVRKDIVIDTHDIVIELKCTRSTMNERNLSEEVASDMIHYGNKHVFFFIYDKGNVVKNPLSFKNTYETKEVDDKIIYLEIFQANNI